jgi:hypothetical protein
MTKRINIGALFLSASLVLSSIAIWSRIHDSTKSSGDTVNLSMTSGYSPPLKCDTALINPTEFDPNLMTAGCIAGWMLTWYSGCIECEGLGLWTASDDFWIQADSQYSSVYTLCHSSEYDWYGQSPEKDSMISLQLMFTHFYCNGEELDYHPEPTRGPLKFGDTGDRVKALQTALKSLGYFEESVALGLDENDIATEGNGIYGPLTICAVMNFQYTAGIDPNGIAGPSTFAALDLQYS